MNTRNLTIGVAALIAAGLALPASALSISSLFGNSDEPVMCTMEAKMCPDGSFVGRTGPNCEFAACPGVSNDDSNTGGSVNAGASGSGSVSGNSGSGVSGSASGDANVSGNVNAGLNSGSGIGAEISAMIKSFFGVSSTSNTDTDTDADTSGSGSANANVSGNAEANANTNAQLNAGLGSLIVTRADVRSNAVIATSRDWASVKSDADLSGYIAAQMKNDENIARVQVSPANVAVTYKQQARFLALVPTTISATAMVDASGDVTVSYPWYSFLFATENDIKAKLQDRVHAIFDANGSLSAAANTTLNANTDANTNGNAGANANASANAEATAKLAAEAQARLVAEIRAVLEEEFSAQLDADAEVNADANAASNV